MRVGLWRRLSTEELMLLNCGVGEDSWESLGLQGDPTSPFWRRSALGCSLEGMMLKLKLQYFGHLMRRVDSLEKTLMLGGIGGRICWVIEWIHRFNYYILSSKVSQHVESMFYKKSLSLPTHTKQAFNQPTDTNPLLDFNSWSDTLDIPCSQDMVVPKGTERDNMRN